MESRAAISNLVYRYAAAVDAGDFDTVGALFSAGRILSTDGRVLAEGCDGVIQFYSNLIVLYSPDDTPRTQHVMSNFMVDIDEDAGRAAGSCNYTVFQQTADLPLQTIIAGHYNDRFERADGEWQFSERRMTATLTGNLEHHIRQQIKDI